ncbi:MAG TPA: group III truncated hemoglobin [Caulobacteraceae bacterium]|jgi:hemoglobin|nr:group III truncated hemoglobin [Caulobacteraceae bacterium]
MAEIGAMPSDTAAARRSEFAETVTRETGIDEAMIARLVHAFYADVRADPLLAPIFAAIVEDWAPHLEQMCAFWSSVVLMTGRYHGRPMDKHLPLPVDATHFDRWLTLFEAAANRECPPAAAVLFVERARRIAESLELGLGGQRGQLLMQGERLRA